MRYVRNGNAKRVPKAYGNMNADFCSAEQSLTLEKIERTAKNGTEGNVRPCDLALKVNHQQIPLAVAALLPHAAVRTSLERKTFGNDEHQTTYGLASHEMQVWYVSLMLAEYLVETLARRVKEGRCNKEGHAPCAVMKAEHVRMLQNYRNGLENLVGEIKKLEKTL